MANKNLITCPYNSAHQIRPERIQYHLIKCAKQYPDADVVICSYNATHHIIKTEEHNHNRDCPDRAIVEIQRYRFNEPIPGQHGNLSNPIVFGSDLIPKLDETLGENADPFEAAGIPLRRRSRRHGSSNPSPSAMSKFADTSLDYEVAALTRTSLCALTDDEDTGDFDEEPRIPGLRRPFGRSPSLGSSVSARVLPRKKSPSIRASEFTPPPIQPTRQPRTVPTTGATPRSSTKMLRPPTLSVSTIAINRSGSMGRGAQLHRALADDNTINLTATDVDDVTEASGGVALRRPFLEPGSGGISLGRGRSRMNAVRMNKRAKEMARPGGDIGIASSGGFETGSSAFAVSERLNVSDFEDGDEEDEFPRPRGRGAGLNKNSGYN